MNDWKSKYAEKLKDVRWQKVRLEKLDAAHWMCQACGEKSNTLHVHHRAYISGREPWDYHESMLVVLCKDCHSDAHAARKAGEDDGDWTEFGEVIYLNEYCEVVFQPYLEVLTLAFEKLQALGVTREDLDAEINARNGAILAARENAKYETNDAQ